MRYLHLTKLPIPVRVRWAREAVLFQLAERGNVLDRTELATVLTETLEQLNVPTQWIQRVLHFIEQLPGEDLETLSTFAKALLSDAEPKSETRPLTVDGPVPTLSPKEHLFRVWTEEGDKYVTELEYKKKYANGPDPHSKKPLVWVNLKTETFSLWVGKVSMRRKPIITGDKKTLFCMFLRNFNKCMSVQYLAKVQEHHPQILHQLHEVTFNVLKPFIEIHTGESRILKPYSKYNYKRKFTFCLIEPVEASDDDK